MRFLPNTLCVLTMLVGCAQPQSKSVEDSSTVGRLEVPSPPALAVTVQRGLASGDVFSIGAIPLCARGLGDEFSVKSATFVGSESIESSTVAVVPDGVGDLLMAEARSLHQRGVPTDSRRVLTKCGDGADQLAVELTRATSRTQSTTHLVVSYEVDGQPATLEAPFAVVFCATEDRVTEHCDETEGDPAATSS